MLAVRHDTDAPSGLLCGCVIQASASLLPMAFSMSQVVTNPRSHYGSHGPMQPLEEGTQSPSAIDSPCQLRANLGVRAGGQAVAASLPSGMWAAQGSAGQPSSLITKDGLHQWSWNLAASRGNPMVLQVSQPPGSGLQAPVGQDKVPQN